MIGKVVNLGLAFIIVVYGSTLYKRYRWWADALVAIAGLAWLVIYLWVLTANPPAELYKLVSDNIVRYVVTFTLLSLAVGLIERGRGK